MKKRTKIFGTAIYGLFHFILCLTRDIDAQKPILIGNQDSVYSFSDLYIYEDTTANLSFAQIKDLDQKHYEHFTGNAPNLGFSNSAFWIKLDVKDTSKNGYFWILDIQMPSLHQVDYYLLTNNKIEVTSHSGFLENKHIRKLPFRNPSLEIPASSSHDATIYARIASQTPIIIPLTLRERNEYLEYFKGIEFFLGIYFGALMIMAVYHSYLSMTIHDRSYLWLVVFIVSFGLGQMTSVYGFLTDWGVKNISAWIPWLHTINFLAAFSAITISRRMVNSSLYAPRVDYFLKIVGYLSILAGLLSPLLGFRYSEQILLLFNIIPLPFLIYPAIVALRKGHRPSLYYLLATISFIAGIAIYNLMYGFGVIPFQSITYFIPNLSFLLTLSLFSIGFADKFNLLKKDREKTQEIALRSLNESLNIQKEKCAIEHELAHSRKMDAVGRLLSGVAHDMRNLLAPIIGYALLLRKASKGNAQIIHYAEQMAQASQRVKDLVNALVDASRKKPISTKYSDVNSIVMQAASLLKYSAPARICLETNLCEESLFTLGDEGMIHSAILNMGVNALDAIPGEGKISITTGRTYLRKHDKLLSNFGIPEGDYLFVSIKDTGTGMSEETQQHLYEPFFTTKAEGKGTGLGLAGVYNCIKVHKGGIYVKSELGKGCCFKLFFPLVAHQMLVNEQNAIPVFSSQAHILVIDDEEPVRKVIAAMLEDLGHISTCVSSGNEALDYIRSNSQRIDLVILDLSMPTMGGKECFEKMIELKPDLITIIMTAQTMDNDLLVLQEMGVAHFLLKPFDLNSLSNAISQCMLLIKELTPQT